MSIQQQVLLRHRAEGHLRFDLPAALAAPDVAENLVRGLRAQEGVYRVEWSPRARKLSIRYQEFVLGFAAVIRQFHSLIGQLAERPAATCCAVPESTGRPLPAVGSSPAESVLVRWLRDRLDEIRETFVAARLVIQQGLNAVRQQPRWLGEFANDLLMLFLIKLHWHDITTLWMPNPWTYRYEWLATFYLIYLQVQSRLPARA